VSAIVMPETDALHTCVVDFLSPMLRNPELGQSAATQAIAGYAPSHGGDLIDAAQIIGLGLAVLDDLRCAVTDAQDLDQTIKLRANASTLARTADQAKTRLKSDRAGRAAQENASLWDELPPAPQVAPAPTNAPPATHPARASEWATAMTELAAEYQAKLPTLDPANQNHHTARINALNQAAATIRQTDPGGLRSTLLSSTAFFQPPAISISPKQRRH
jgi:hypothetical protein